MLQVSHLTCTSRRDQRVFIRDFSYTVSPGEKTVLIGEEGNGKSTLLRYFYDPALIEPYMEVSGTRVCTRERLAYLPQSLPEEERSRSVYEYFLAEDLFSQQTPRQLSQLAHTFQVDESFWYEGQTMGSLSGGEQIKAQLARLSLHQPTIYLLDEPSSNLDLGILVWLEDFIRKAPQAVLFVSHDEELIEKTAEGVIHLELLNRKHDSRITAVRMPYREYLQQRQLKLDHDTRKALGEKREEAIRQEKLNRLQNAVAYDLQHVSRQDPHTGQLLKKKMHAVKAMEHRFEKQKENSTELPQTEQPMVMTLGPGRIESGKKVLALQLPRLETPEGDLLAEHISLTLYSPRHVAIIGRNGAGKTTLLHAVCQALADSPYRVGYMPQDYAEILDPEKTPVGFLAPDGRQEEITKARSWLGAMRYTTLEMEHPVRELSGGQQGKLILLKMALDEDQILILDEPTRNFSPLSQPVLMQAMQDFQGVILCVSHDRRFLEQVPDTILELRADGLHPVTDFPGRKEE